MLLGDDDAEFLEDPLAESTIRRARRQCTAGIERLPSIAASAARCAPFRRDSCAAAFRWDADLAAVGIDFIAPIATIWSVAPRSSPPRSGSRRRDQPPAPEAAWPEARPSTTSAALAVAHTDQPEVEWASQTCCARHLE